jgi:hypothetical protein
MLAVNNIYWICQEFADPGKHPLTGVASATVKRDPNWKVAFETLKTYCGEQTSLDARAASLSMNFDVWMEHAAKQGNQFAALYSDAWANGWQLPASDRLAAYALLKSAPGGEVSERVTGLLIASDDPDVRQLEDDLLGRSISEQDRQTIRTSVAQLYACKHGANCGPRGLYQMGGCLTNGWCDRNLPVNEYLRRYKLSRSQAALVDAYLAGFEAAVDKH